MKYLALALLLVAATPAFAGDDFPYPAFGNEIDSGALDDAAEIVPSPDFNGTIDLASGLNLALDLTPMNVVTTAFDNPPQTYQHLGYTTTWACFTDAGRRVWYIADQTYETRDEAYVSVVIDEPADPVTDALFLCKPNASAMLRQNPALPAVGARLDELNAFYKLALPAGTRYLSGYADTGKGSVMIYYRLTRDVVDAISIGGSALGSSE